MHKEDRQWLQKHGSGGISHGPILLVLPDVVEIKVGFVVVLTIVGTHIVDAILILTRTILESVHHITSSGVAFFLRVFK
jgi:hypothetical protein